MKGQILLNCVRHLVLGLMAIILQWICKQMVLVRMVLIRGCRIQALPNGRVERVFYTMAIQAVQTVNRRYFHWVLPMLLLRQWIISFHGLMVKKMPQRLMRNNKLKLVMGCF